jgi:glycosyltransferase involved in cell wall biosynthesis
MKVALLLQDTRALYGAERATLRLAGGLAAAGVRVRALLLREERMGAGESPLAAAFRAVAPTREIPVRGRFSREAVGAIRGWMAREGIGVLHSTGYKADWHAGVAAEWGARFAVASTVHGWLFRSSPKERLYQELNVRALARFSRVITLCGYYETYLRRRGLHPTLLARIPTGVPAGDWVDRSRSGALWDSGGAPFTFGALGRLSEEKNHELLLRAAARMARRLDASPQAWRILVAGEGPLRGRLEALAERLGVADRVEWAGWMESADFFGRVHVLVQCSRVENQPMSVMEAMAWARPVLATRTGGLPELVAEGQTGWLVPEGNVRALARAMEERLRLRKGAREAGERGRERLEREFDFQRMVEAHVGLYGSLGG